MRARDAVSWEYASVLERASATRSVNSAMRVSVPGANGPSFEITIIAPHR